jgi:hypothetical protein
MSIFKAMFKKTEICKNGFLGIFFTTEFWTTQRDLEKMVKKSGFSVKFRVK